MYESTVLIATVRRCLEGQPGCSLASIAATLGVDRHTITRQLKLHCGVTFVELQDQYLRMALEKLNANPRLVLRKEIAQELGLRSTQALLRRRRKLAQCSRVLLKCSRMTCILW